MKALPIWSGLRKNFYWLGTIGLSSLLEIVISTFKSNQIREPIPETPDPIQKTYP